jgi:PAS domain S-box-containing protein
VPAAIEAIVMLDAVPTPLLTIDGAGRINGANRAAADLFGCSRERLVGTTLKQWSPNVAAIEEFLSAGAGLRNLDVRLSDGSTRRLAATLAQAAGGGELVLSLFDVTERAILEANLREERDRYLDIAPRRRDGTVTMKTPVGRWPDDIADTTYDPEGFAAWQRMHEAHLPYRNIVFRQRRRDGKEQYLRSSAVPYYKAGVFQGYRGLSVDVTAQMLAERAFRRSQRHLEHAQRVAAIGSVERDLATGTEEWSPEMFRILGIERESFERTDENILRLIHEEDRAMVKAGLERARAGIPVPSAEYRIVRPDGEVRTLYAEADFFRDDAGKPIRLLTVFKDVTELRAAERRQAEAEQQLQHAQKMESLGTLAGGVAHGIIAAHGGRILVESELGRGTRIEVILPAAADIEVVCFEPCQRAVS